MDSLFFEMMRKTPNKQKSHNLLDGAFKFKIVLNRLSIDVEQYNTKVLGFEKQLKKVRHEKNIKHGQVDIKHQEVINQDTRKIALELAVVDQKLQQIKQLMQEYTMHLNQLQAKMITEENFTEKLERERRTFAEEHSQIVSYDMSSIDEIFDEMMNQPSNNSWSSLIVNMGMVMVTMASVGLWIKLKGYESKNA